MNALKTSFAVMVALVLVAFALASLPPSVTAQPTEDSACPMARVQLDSGYGVSRTEERHVCGR